MLAVCSAVIDLYAVFGNRQTVLNFKVHYFVGKKLPPVLLSLTG
jgi:hypothetical protein